MSEHTPGPWRASFFAGQWCVLHKGGDDTTILAPVGSGFAEGSNGKANARLMAAAPDMLAALKECERVLVILADEKLDLGAKGVFAEILRAAITPTRAAIAKATGHLGAREG